MQNVMMTLGSDRQAMRFLVPGLSTPYLRIDCLLTFHFVLDQLGGGGFVYHSPEAAHYSPGADQTTTNSD